MFCDLAHGTSGQDLLCVCDCGLYVVFPLPPQLHLPANSSWFQPPLKQTILVY